MSPIRLMIAENCQSYATILRDYISTVYSDIVVIGIASNGVKALRMLQSKSPDVLLLDIVMPSLDGLQVLERISKADDRPTVFVMSALDNQQIIDRAIALGADQYFVKPLDIDKLVSSIRETVRVNLSLVQ